MQTHTHRLLLPKNWLISKDLLVCIIWRNDLSALTASYPQSSCADDMNEKVTTKKSFSSEISVAYIQLYVVVTWSCLAHELLLLMCVRWLFLHARALTVDVCWPYVDAQLRFSHSPFWFYCVQEPAQNARELVGDFWPCLLFWHNLNNSNQAVAGIRKHQKLWVLQAFNFFFSKINFYWNLYYSLF